MNNIENLVNNINLISSKHDSDFFLNEEYRTRLAKSMEEELDELEIPYEKAFGCYLILESNTWQLYKDFPITSNDNWWLCGDF